MMKKHMILLSLCLAILSVGVARAEFFKKKEVPVTQDDIDAAISTAGQTLDMVKVSGAQAVGAESLRNTLKLQIRVLRYIVKNDTKSGPMATTVNFFNKTIKNYNKRMKAPAERPHVAARAKWQLPSGAQPVGPPTLPPRRRIRPPGRPQPETAAGRRETVLMEEASRKYSQ